MNRSVWLVAVLGCSVLACELASEAQPGPLWQATSYKGREIGKLTGDGVTFFDADVLHLFEAVLPRRFGGTLADYQLVETQTAEGLPRYELLVSPELGPLDEPALVAGFLDELARLRRPYPFMAGQWARSGALRVRRARPEPGAHGKVLPFRTLGPS